jgi:hypothetical protein
MTHWKIIQWVLLLVIYLQIQPLVFGGVIVQQVVKYMKYFTKYIQLFLQNEKLEECS